MRVFVTGATGFVGSAVVKDLLSAGHQVLGLARSEEKATALKAMGAEAHRGDLSDLDSLRRGAAEADGVMHLGFNHDFSRFADNAAEDARAIKALGAALEGLSRPLLATSGLAGLAQGRLAVETDRPPPSGFPRVSEAAIEAVAARGVRASVVRLPPSTHGAGDHGFVPILIDIARSKGASAYVGEGANRWPAAHRADAAAVYRLAMEAGAAGGPWHAIDEEGVPFKAIAEAIGRGLDLPVISVAPEDAAAHFDWFAMFASADIPASSAHTRETLGWTPTQPGLIADMAAHYF